MNGLPVEIIVILCGVGAVALLWLLLRFGKTIARALLVGALVVAAVLGLLILLAQGATNFQAARAATKTAEVAQTLSKATAINSTMQTVLVVAGGIGAAFCIGTLGTLALVATGTAGVLWARWQLAERKRARLNPGQNAHALPDLPVLPVLPVGRHGGRQGAVQPGQVILVLDDAEESPVVDLAGIDLAEWGW